MPFNIAFLKLKTTAAKKTRKKERNTNSIPLNFNETIFSFPLVLKHVTSYSVHVCSFQRQGETSQLKTQLINTHKQISTNTCNISAFFAS
jgi:hypothetical protein